MGQGRIIFGPDWFYSIKEKGLMMPDVTFIRVDNSPCPDIGYVVDSHFMLKSDGPGKENMSLMGAEEGVYDPEDALDGRLWSIYEGLRLALV